jgi:hypothetical protein
MRTLFIAIFFALFSVTAVAQTAPPPWPEIRLTSCPKIVPPLDPNRRTWASQAEQSDFVAASQMLQAKNYTGASEGFAKFAEQYPLSDFREVALTAEMGAQSHLNDENGLVKIAEQQVSLAEATWMVRESGFVTLVGALSNHVPPDDPEKDRKLADLERWTQCGREAVAAGVPSASMPPDVLVENRKMAEGFFNRTDGAVALMREQYGSAETKLQMAYRQNPQDALTCLWLFETKTFSETPDLNSGVFYLARWATLAPDVKASTNFLKQVYGIDHGSEKGLSEVLALAKANTLPPPGFNVLPPPKEKHHYGTAIAATALIGLFAYEIAKHPEVGRSIAESFSAPAPAKIMIFGGQDHRVYLGCLNCAALYRDSVYNEAGVYGSRVRPESIWNAVGEYGSRVSQYSACNPVASDPPLIVDDTGTAYGRLTLNRVSSNIGGGARFYDWLSTVVCQR